MSQWKICGNKSRPWGVSNSVNRMKRPTQRTALAESGYPRRQGQAINRFAAYDVKSQTPQGGGTKNNHRREGVDVMRTKRRRKGRTQRKLPAAARVSLGSLSEV